MRATLNRKNRRWQKESELAPARRAQLTFLPGRRLEAGCHRNRQASDLSTPVRPAKNDAFPAKDGKHAFTLCGKIDLA